MPWRRALGWLAEAASDNPFDIGLLVVFAALSFVGGLVKALRCSKLKSWLEILAEAVTSAVAGVTVGALLLWLWGPEQVYLIMAIVGVSGWVGVSLMDLLGTALLRAAKAWLSAANKE